MLLVVEGEGLSMPPAALGCLVAFLGPFLVMPLFFGIPFASVARVEPIALVFVGVYGLFWFGLLGVGLTAAYRRGWLTRALRVDGRGGVLEIVDRHVLTGKDRTESVPLPQLVGAKVRVAATTGSRGPAPAGISFTPPNVRLLLRIDGGSGRVRERKLALGVEGIDKREEVADLAYRLGAAAGLAYQRVLRSDPRDIEIELSRSGAPGSSRIPALEGRADYARDQVASAAAAAAQQERIPPFDPSQFSSDHKVAEWSPRSEVRFQKPLGFAAVGCLPFVVVGFLAGPALFFLTGQHPENDLGGRIVGSLFIGFFGLVIGGVALLMAYGALPRRVVFDWSTRTITISGLVRRSELAFADLNGLVLNCVRTYHSGGRNSSSHHSYRCELNASVRDPTGGRKHP